MPVTFKVPKQKKRSKFVIDTFQGVDFTNAGINVDPSRSPNAPNMVRHVPGKVRKRMGYSKEIYFGPDTNVNFAKTSSMKSKEFMFNQENVGVTQLLTELIEPISGDFYVEFDYKAEDDYSIYVDRDLFITQSDDWTHASLEVLSGDLFDKVLITSATEQEIYIKNFSIMMQMDSNYKWSPAPKALVSLSGDNCFYGHHSIRSKADTKPSYVNVNRVVSASSTVSSYTLSGDTWTDIGQLWEEVYTNSSNAKRRLYVEFDYTLTHGAHAYIAAAGTYNSKHVLEGTPSFIHFSGTWKAGSYTNKKIRARKTSGTGNATLVIKNLFVGYGKNSNYSWAKAPDDNGDYRTSSLYWDGRKNYAEVTDYTNSFTANWERYYDEATIIPSTAEGIDGIKGFCKVKFQLQTSASTTANLTYKKLYLIDQDNNIRHTITSPSNTTYELYVSLGAGERYVSKVGIDYQYSTSAERTINNAISSIEVKEIAPRDIAREGDLFDIYHVGKKFYLKRQNDLSVQQMYSNAALQKSMSATFGEELIILDGKDIYTYEANTAAIEPVSSYGPYIPTITISKNPSGGGTPYESINMLTPGFEERFIVTSDQSSTVNFQLSFSNLDATKVRAWTLQNTGAWYERTEGTHFTVNRTTGVVTFLTAPGTTPIAGEDNVRIRAYHTIAGYRDRIAKCRFITVYGESGRSDRVFVGGNPEYPSRDFYSQENDWSYFPDTNYSSLGASTGEVMGYAYLNNNLATFKQEASGEKSLIIRTLDTVFNEEENKYETWCKTIGTLQGDGPVSYWTTGYLNGEPLYLSKNGIYAITPRDGADQDYGQNRSFFLNEKLKKEPGLEDAYATVFNNMYIVALNNQLYILDGLQPTRTEGDPYSLRQYSAFYCDDIPATCIWNDGEDLWFGTADGKLCKFYSDPSDGDAYNDDGFPISAWWETPDLDGYLFYKNKTFRYFAMRMMRAFRSSCKLWAEKQSLWSFIKEDRATMTVFDFENIDFEWFSFSTDWSEKIVHTKLRVKKVDKARFKIENSELNQPLGLYDLALEYLESGNYKR